MNEDIILLNCEDEGYFVCRESENGESEGVNRKKPSSSVEGVELSLKS